MARAQVFRGDPELKQTILFDNFSGGINTAAIDEQVATNEFRKLINVELKEQGRIQNRKGFGNIKVINRYFSNVFNDDYTYYHIEIVKDKDNLLHTLSDYNHIIDNDPNGTLTWNEVRVQLPEFSITFEMVYKQNNQVWYELKNINNVTNFPKFYWKETTEEFETPDAIVTGLDNLAPPNAINLKAKRIGITNYNYYWKAVTLLSSPFDYTLGTNDTLPKVIEENLKLRRELPQNDDYQWVLQENVLEGPFDFDLSISETLPTPTQNNLKLRKRAQVTTYKLQKTEFFTGPYTRTLSQGTNPESVPNIKSNDKVRIITGTSGVGWVLSSAEPQEPLFECVDCPPTASATPGSKCSCSEGMNRTVYEYTGINTYDYYVAVPDQVVEDYIYYKSEPKQEGTLYEYFESNLITTKDPDIYYISQDVPENIIKTSLFNQEAIFKTPKITGLNIMNYDSKKFFLLNEVVESNENIVEIIIEDDELINAKNKVLIINKQNSYRPNVTEISNIGFNIFSNTPHTHISRLPSSVESIRSLSIFKYKDSSIRLDKIPTSGKFRVHAYYTGLPSLFNEVVLKLYNETWDGEKEYLNADVEKIYNESSDGLMIFDIKNLVMRNNKDVFIEIEKTELNQLYETFKSFEKRTDLVNHYLNYTMNSGNKIYKFLVNNHYDGYASLLQGSEVNPWLYEDCVVKNISYYDMVENTISTKDFGTKRIPLMPNANRTVEKQYEVNGVHYTEYHIPPNAYNSSLYLDLSWYSLFMLTEFNNSYHIYLFKANKSGENVLFKAYNPDLQYYGLSQYYSVILTVNGSNKNHTDYILSENDIFRIEDEDKYYRYNFGTTGTFDDFEEVQITETETLVSYINSFSVGTPKEDRLTNLNFSNLKGKIIGDRMVLFTENTILFSDTYSSLDDGFGNRQGFSYFPSFNWIVLPLVSGDTIQSINYYRGSYMIFTKENVYRMSGTFMGEDFSITLINDAIGCVSPDSVRSMNNTLIFLSRDGLYAMKQNYYMDGLENVGKIDALLSDEIPYGENYESIIDNEQYLLFVKDKQGNYVKTIKQYYNMQNYQKATPYTIDIYREVPDLMFKSNVDYYAYKNGELYNFNRGYVDFMPHDIFILENYTYEFEVRTPDWSFGYPLHEKKFKNVFLKLESNMSIPITFEIYIDRSLKIGDSKFVSTVNSYGEIEYTLVSTTNLRTISNLNLGFSELGNSALGNYFYQVYKINPAQKGRTVGFGFKFKHPGMFAVDSINIVYKLGKMRESR